MEERVVLINWYVEDAFSYLFVSVWYGIIIQNFEDLFISGFSQIRVHLLLLKEEVLMLYLNLNLVFHLILRVWRVFASTCFGLFFNRSEQRLRGFCGHQSRPTEVLMWSTTGRCTCASSSTLPKFIEHFKSVISILQTLECIFCSWTNLYRYLALQSICNLRAFDYTGD